LRKKHGKTSVRVAARASQADTVQYKKNEQYNTQKKNINKEQYSVTEQYRTQNTQQRKQSISGKGKGKVPHWGTSTPQPQGLLCSHPERVPSFISRGAAHQTVYSSSTSEGRNYVKGILLPI
jgi:hypothetical protein